MLLKFDIAQLSSPAKFQQAWFERFWTFFGWASRILFAGDVEAVMSKASGVVVDLGTGAGDWLYLFAPSHNPNITKLILLEPNTNFHSSLRTRAHELGLDGKYEIIGAPAQEIERYGYKAGSIDTVTTVHVLCSVGQPEPIIKALYRILKPGGQFLVYEHIANNSGNKLAETWQRESATSSLSI